MLSRRIPQRAFGCSIFGSEREIWREALIEITNKVGVAGGKKIIDILDAFTEATKMSFPDED